MRSAARLFFGRSGVGNPLLDLGCKRFTPEGVEHGSAVERFTQPPGPETRETLLFGAACALLLAAKLLALVYYRIDSDQPQHLHVVWNWLHVGVGYRDFFDNHTPLFHLMCVPVLALVGEHAATLLTLRLVSLVSFEVSVPETYVFLGRGGALGGELDGAPLKGAAFLAAGHHRLCGPADPGQVALFWAHAYACGYTPFVALPPDALVPGD